MRNWPVMTLSAGPVEITDRTMREQARPVLYHYDPAFIDFFAHTTELLKRVFKTEYDVIILQGEAILGLEAAAACLISPGDKTLNLVSGVFGKWFEDFIVKYGGVPVELRVPYDEAVDPQDVRAALRRDPDIKFLSVVHSETPSGTVNPVKEIARIAKEFSVITIVDTVSGLGGQVLSPEEWCMDVAVAGPQKCLGGVPGLSLISVSPDAWKAMEERKPALRGSYLSMLDWKTAWLENGRFPHTPLVSDVYALESVLSQVLAEGLEQFAWRHAAIAKACREGVRALGLHVWAAREEIAGTCCTSVSIPEGLTDKQIRGTMRDRYGVMTSGGYGVLAGKLFRLGHMGKAAHPTYLAAQLAILERTLEDLKWPVEMGRGVGAAMQALAGWDDLGREQA
jgi:pyridoxamine---pyruvate transaminase